MPRFSNNSFSPAELIEVFGFASRFYVEIRVIAGRSLRRTGIVLIVRGQFLDLIVDLLAHQEALLDPSGHAG